MKTYGLQIAKHNIKPYLTIENAIKTKRNGLFTFNLRVSQSNIEDFATFETVTGKDFTGIEFTITE